MMSKPNSRNRSNEPSNTPIKLRLKLPFTHTTTASSANPIITLGFDGESTLGTVELPDISDTMLDFQQLYRYFRINRAILEIRTGPSFTEPEGGAVLCWVPPEISTAPTSYNNVETLFQVPVILHAEGNQLGNKLTLNRTRLGGLSDWLTTSSLTDTGIVEYFSNMGAIYLLTANALTVSQSIFCLLYLDMEFKTLFDPDLLRANMLKLSDQVDTDLGELSPDEKLMLLRNRRRQKVETTPTKKKT